MRDPGRPSPECPTERAICRRPARARAWRRSAERSHPDGAAPRRAAPAWCGAMRRSEGWGPTDFPSPAWLGDPRSLGPVSRRRRDPGARRPSGRRARRCSWRSRRRRSTVVALLLVVPRLRVLRVLVARARGVEDRVQLGAEGDVRADVGRSSRRCSRTGVPTRSPDGVQLDPADERQPLPVVPVVVGRGAVDGHAGSCRRPRAIEAADHLVGRAGPSARQRSRSRRRPRSGRTCRSSSGGTDTRSRSVDARHRSSTTGRWTSSRRGGVTLVVKTQPLSVDAAHWVSPTCR